MKRFNIVGLEFSPLPGVCQYIVKIETIEQFVMMLSPYPNGGNGKLTA